MCGESWLAIKDSFTHRPSSQGWTPRVLLSRHVGVFPSVVGVVFFIALYGCYRVLGDISFLSFFLSPNYGWCAIHNGFHVI